jgi:triacylglycerol lipase
MPPIPANVFNSLIPNTTQWRPANARALVYAAQLAYGVPVANNPAMTTITQDAQTGGINPAQVKVIDPGTTVLQAVVLGGQSFVILAFRGTRPDQLSDWMDDAEIAQVPFNSIFDGPDVGLVHNGFANLLKSGWDDICDAVNQLQQGGQSLWITGHSLGGALAVMAAAAFTFSRREPVNGLYTYGQPRVGDVKFCAQCDSQFGDEMFRFVNNQDIVTRIPPRLVVAPPMNYGHSGQLRYFDPKGALHSDYHWWNNFLLNVDVDFDHIDAVLANPIQDHFLENYIAAVENFIAGGGNLAD